jgi:transcriptional regulator with XRE-family HTH domain
LLDSSIDSNLYVTFMLGETIRASRIKKGLTQARLARLAGVSRRHLAALEKGANVSVLVLKKVAFVLDLTEIDLGTLSLITSKSSETPVNLPLLADTVREAYGEAQKAQSLLARAEGLLTGARSGGMVISFPRLPVRRTDVRERRAATGQIADGSELAQVLVAGEIRQGTAVTELSADKVAVPSKLIEKGEVVFRVRGEKLRDQGIEDGDLLVVQLRQHGRAATGELVVAQVGNDLFVGRWWQKHGQKALMSDGLSEVTTGTPKKPLKVLAAVNQIIRPTV